MRLTFTSRQDWLKSRRQPPSLRLSDYATPEQIADLRAKLIDRFRNVTGQNAEDRRFARSCIRLCIRSLDRDQIPSKSDVTEDLLATIRQRFEAARDTVPDDLDEVWEQELLRRDELRKRYENVA